MTNVAAGLMLSALLAGAQPPGATPLMTRPAPPPPPASSTQPPAPDDQADAPADEGPGATVSLRPIDLRMTVSVMVNGAGPFRFIVDSGATRTVVSRRLATLLGLPSAGTATLHSVGGESEVDTVRIGALALTGLPSQAVVAPVLEEENLGAAGILGIDMLENKKVVIDLVANRMSVEPSGRGRPRATSGEIIVTARRRYGQLVLADADANGQRIYAVVDTGSNVTIGNIALRDRLVRRRRADTASMEIVDVAGHVVIGQYARINGIRIGPAKISNATIAFSDAHAFARFGLDTKPSMLLGMDLLRGFRRVSIDFRNRTVTFSAPELRG